VDHQFRPLSSEDSEIASLAAGSGLVESAVTARKGMGISRRLRIGGSAAIVGLAVLAGTFGVRLAFADTHGAAGGTQAAGVQMAGAPGTASPAAVAGGGLPWTPPSGAPASGPRVPATGAGLLELLNSLLPAGKTSGYEGGSRMVQTYLDDGSGPGMIRVFVGMAVPDSQLAEACAKAKRTTCHQLGVPSPTSSPVPLGSGFVLPSAAATGVTSDYRSLPDGSVVEIFQVPDNCVQRVGVSLVRPDGTTVALDVASCLAWDGKTNPKGRLALTVDQAVAIADDPRWGTTIAQSLVDAGAKDYPNLKTIG